MAHDVFISHSSKDKAVAAAICSALENAQIRCWVAPRDIPPASEWASSIVDALKSARVMVLIFSEHSNSSKHVGKELTVAADAGVVIVPLKIDDTPLGGLMEYYLSDTHWLDAMNPPTEQQIAGVLDTVRPIVQAKGGGAIGLGRPAETAESRPPETAESRPKVTWPVMLAIALAVVAIAIGAWAVLRPNAGGSGASAQVDSDVPEFATLTEGVLTVAIASNYPPFESMRNGELVGFDVDMMNALAQRLEVSLDFRTMEFGTLIPELLLERCDMIASSLTINEARAGDIAFSDPYYNNDQALFVQSGSRVTALATMVEGDSLAVITEQSGELIAESEAPEGLRIMRYEDYTACAQAVADGRADAAMLDRAVAEGVCDPGSGLYVASEPGLEVVELWDTGEQFGFALRKDDTALLEAVNSALADLKEDRTYSRIYREWFGYEPDRIP